MPPMTKRELPTTAVAWSALGVGIDGKSFHVLSFGLYSKQEVNHPPALPPSVRGGGSEYPPAMTNMPFASTLPEHEHRLPGNDFTGSQCPDRWPSALAGVNTTTESRNSSLKVAPPATITRPSSSTSAANARRACGIGACSDHVRVAMSNNSTVVPVTSSWSCS